MDDIMMLYDSIKVLLFISGQVWSCESASHKIDLCRCILELLGKLSLRLAHDTGYLVSEKIEVLLQYFSADETVFMIDPLLK